MRGTVFITLLPSRLTAVRYEKFTFRMTTFQFVLYGVHRYAYVKHVHIFGPAGGSKIWDNFIYLDYNIRGASRK